MKSISTNITLSVLAFILALFSGIRTEAQDLHYSQYYNTPLIINPAKSGVFNGDHRAIMIYRNQWASVTSPYKTFGASFDMRLLDKDKNNFKLGTGLMINNDVAGDAQYSITNVALNISGILNLDKHNFLSAGAGTSFEQRGISNSNLMWDEQFDGKGYNSSLHSGETQTYDSPLSYFDLSAGINWKYSSNQATITSNDYKMFQAGLTYNHITKPNIGYLNQDKMYNRYTGHASAFIGINNTPYAILPSAVYQKQGPAQEILAGALFRYSMKNASKYTGFIKGAAISFGLHTRFKDALIPSLNLELANWKLGFSYDSNISGLNETAKAVGGYEVSLIFINPNPFSNNDSSKPRF